MNDQNQHPCWKTHPSVLHTIKLSCHLLYHLSTSRGYLPSWWTERLAMKHKVWQYWNMLYYAGRAHQEGEDERLCSKCHDAYLWAHWSGSLYKHHSPSIKQNHYSATVTTCEDSAVWQSDQTGWSAATFSCEIDCHFDRLYNNMSWG